MPIGGVKRSAAPASQTPCPAGGKRLKPHDVLHGRCDSERAKKETLRLENTALKLRLKCMEMELLSGGGGPEALERAAASAVRLSLPVRIPKTKSGSQKSKEPVAVQYPCVDLTHEPEIADIVGPPKTSSSFHVLKKGPRGK
jgi:hypothetical protein